MTIPLLGSASSLYRTLVCPASVHLPQTPETSTPEALRRRNRGTEIHRYLAGTPIDDIDPEFREEIRRNHPTWLVDSAGAVVSSAFKELSFAWDGISGSCTILLPRAPREYGLLREDELPGTPDVIIPGYGVGEVWDYKTGRPPYDSPDKNPQLLFGAMCASKTLAPKAKYWVVGIQLFKERKSPVAVESTPALVDRATLANFEHRLLVAQERAKVAVGCIASGRDPEVVKGYWCRFCNAKPACPAWRDSE